MSTGMIAGLIATALGGGGLGALLARPKMKAEAKQAAAIAERVSAEAAAGLIQTATDAVMSLVEPLQQRVDVLEQEGRANRKTILAQQETIAEQGRTIALQNTQLNETRSRLSLLERSYFALQDWVRENGGDPQKILANLGHPPGPSSIGVSGA